MTVSNACEDIDGIAIIGMAGRFPGANNLAEFWHNLKNGVESVTYFTEEELRESGVDPVLLNNPNYVKSGAVLPEADRFDAPFFSIAAGEADFMDPQHRVFLECAWEAFETAGYVPDKYKGAIGVYAGCSLNYYMLNNLLSNRELTDKFGGFQALLGNDKDFLATRLSYKLNLTGPSLDIQTACSTSLVAVQVACQSLQSYQCDMALAGGVSIGSPLKRGYLYQEGLIMSPDGHCRPFDASAQGTIFGDGVGIVILKRLEDAIEDGDHISAVIRGAAINNDGSAKVGFTAPSVDGQSRVIMMAQALADVPADTISYIEAHGTGTPLGDPIEIAALTQAFRECTDSKGFCAIGSVKSNIGHLDAAAGIAGLIKTVLAIEHQQIPPSLNFNTPNPKLELADSPFYVNTTLSRWPQGETPRRAGVSAFGIGGTNAHLIVEEFASQTKTTISTPASPYHLLVLSAKTEAALSDTTERMSTHLKRNPDINLSDAAFTLQTGREEFNHRHCLVCKDLQSAINSFETLDPVDVCTLKVSTINPQIIFLFPGQGSQYVNMAFELYGHSKSFREDLDRCDEFLYPLIGVHLKSIIYPGDETRETAVDALKQTSIAQPALFAIEYALARLWLRWGLKPGAMIGHSLGEFVAACLAEVMTLEEALSAIAFRAKLMQEQPEGCMLAVHLPENDVQPLTGHDVSLAAVNSPSLCTLSGTLSAVADLESKLKDMGVRCQRIHTSHAFHSEMMRPVTEPFKEKLKKIRLSPPKIPYISNVTGTWITDKEATDPDYWARHILSPVRFSDGLQLLMQEPNSLLLEVGPGQTLCILSSLQTGKPEKPLTFSSLRHPLEEKSDVSFIFETLGKLWLNGIQVDWAGFNGTNPHQRIPLPAYPFKGKRHWIKPASSVSNRSGEDTASSFVNASQSPANQPPESSSHLEYIENKKAVPTILKANKFTQSSLRLVIIDVWKELLGIDHVSTHDNFFDLGGNSLLSVSAINMIRLKTGLKIHPRHFIFQSLGQIAAICAGGPADETTSSDGTESRDSFFFGSAAKQLFGCYHGAPPDSSKKWGFVLCYPLGQEYIRCHRTFLQMAVRMSRAGFPVLRFDYFGCGDSAGSLEEATIAHWVEDISTAANELKKRSGIENVCVLGLRLGGTLAVLAGQQANSDIDGFVLWNPVVEGDNYIKELHMLQKESLRTIYVSGKNGKNKNAYEFLGYSFSKNLIGDIRALDLFSNSDEIFRKKNLIIKSGKMDDWEMLKKKLSAINSEPKYVELSGANVWLEEPFREIVQQPVITSAIDWAKEVLS